MTNQILRDPTTPISEILKAARPDGIVLEMENQVQFAVLPLDDDVLDLLIERNPKFRAVCQEIRADGRRRVSDARGSEAGAGSCP